MTRKIGNAIILEPEADSKCELCGAVEETRPYGPNGERICYGCGMKNKQQTEQMMRHTLFGDLDS